MKEKRIDDRAVSISIQRPGDVPESYIEERCYIAEYLNNDAEQNLSVSRARVEPGAVTALHLLKGTAERYIIVAGEGEMEINGKIWGSVWAGDVVNIPPDTSQRIRNTGGKDLVFFCICTPRFDFSNYVHLE